MSGESFRISSQCSGLYPQGSIFHHKAFPRLYTGFLQSHEVGLGVGLAVFHIKTGHHQVAPEYARKIMVQSVDEADLPRSGDDHGGEAIGLYLFQQLVSARHPWGFRTTAEHEGRTGGGTIDLLAQRDWGRRATEELAF